MCLEILVYAVDLGKDFPSLFVKPTEQEKPHRKKIKAAILTSQLYW